MFALFSVLLRNSCVRLSWVQVSELFTCPSSSWVWVGIWQLDYELFKSDYNSCGISSFTYFTWIKADFLSECANNGLGCGAQAGKYVTSDVTRSLVVVISNANDLHGYTVRTLYRVFQAWGGQVLSELFMSWEWVPCDGLVSCVYKLGSSGLYATSIVLGLVHCGGKRNSALWAVIQQNFSWSSRITLVWGCVLLLTIGWNMAIKWGGRISRDILW